jgi:hypothetical protein
VAQEVRYRYRPTMQERQELSVPAQSTQGETQGEHWAPEAKVEDGQEAKHWLLWRRLPVVHVRQRVAVVTQVSQGGRQAMQEVPLWT